MSDYCGINANAYAMFVCLFFSPFSLSGWVGKCVCAATVLPMPMDTMFGYNSLPHSLSCYVFYYYFLFFYSIYCHTPVIFFIQFFILSCFFVAIFFAVFSSEQYF